MFICKEKFTRFLTKVPTIRRVSAKWRFSSKTLTVILPFLEKVSAIMRCPLLGVSTIERVDCTIRVLINDILPGSEGVSNAISQATEQSDEPGIWLKNPGHICVSMFGHNIFFEHCFIAGPSIPLTL